MLKETKESICKHSFISDTKMKGNGFMYSYLKGWLKVAKSFPSHQSTRNKIVK